ncbi:MAG: efflux RND transporter periplasmic adaptor subunit [Pseudomonadota bacterium]
MNFMKKTLPIAIAVSLAMTMAACDSAKETPAPAPKAGAAADAGLVTVSPELMQRLKIFTIGKDEVRDMLRVPGRVTVDEQHVARIGATVTGRISEVYAILGQEVTRGQMLAKVNSTELAEAQLAYLKALSQVELQSRSVERARLLLSADVIGSAELQKRENELFSSQAELLAAEDHLQVLGMLKQAVTELGKRRDINSVTPVTATLSGTVIERKVTQGQVVQPADALFTVANLSHVWVVAEVPEQQADLVREGKDVEVEIPALQEQRFTGRLIYVADTVNPETRTVTVRTDLANHERAIKPDMLATMLIQGRPLERIVVPAEAVVREGGKDYVFVQAGPAQFRMTEVTLGTESEGMRPVKSGLREGDKVVTEGAFHLNNERKRKELG